MYRCKYCGREFETHTKLGGHIGRCKCNPKREENCKIYIESCHKANRTQISHKQIIPRDLICHRCGKHYTLLLSDQKFKSGKYTKFCSRSCANSRGEYSEERKMKISQGVRQHLKDIGYSPVEKQDDSIRSKSMGQKQPKLYKKLTVIKVCERCGNEFIVPSNHKNRKYCCKECMIQSRHDKLSEAGKKSALVQGDERRSKNEKLFCSFCEHHFKHVEHNQPLFNGWDADVLIYDLKIAVLWNGVWHYKKITDQHSVKQVQNRDNLKINEIKNMGWIPYVIEDKGKYNPNFVKTEFDKFISTLTIR